MPTKKKNGGIPILILKCASLAGRDTSCMYRVHRMHRGMRG